MIDRRRLAMVLGLLGSSHDGEIVAAARQAEKLRHEAGVSWGEILGAEAGGDDPIETLIDNLDQLSDWEQRFVRSIATRDAETLTSKQRAVVNRLVRGLRARQAA
jgi:hypothetical protein